MAEVIAEGVHTAAEASAATEKPVVVETVVEGTPKVEETPVAAGPADTTMGEAITAKAEPEIDAATSPTSDQINGNANNRLFVGCVPSQFSEDDLKVYFEPVCLLNPTSPVLIPLLSLLCHRLKIM